MQARGAAMVEQQQAVRSPTTEVQPCLGKQKKKEKMLNGEKEEKTHVFNEFTVRVLNSRELDVKYSRPYRLDVKYSIFSI